MDIGIAIYLRGPPEPCEEVVRHGLRMMHKSVSSNADKEFLGNDTRKLSNRFIL